MENKMLHIKLPCIFPVVFTYLLWAFISHDRQYAYSTSITLYTTHIYLQRGQNYGVAIRQQFNFHENAFS